ncbi:MAG: hypothetical protein V4760_05690 [Bdellovibrionota bacterium]
MKLKSRLAFAAVSIVTVTSMGIGCARSPNNGAQVKPGTPKPTGSPTPENAVKKADLDVAIIVKDTKMTKEVKAEELAKKAELLYAAEAIDLAVKVADLALKEDANNLRAKLVKALIAPVMVQKGILARIAPFAKTNDQLKDKLEKYEADMRAAVTETPMLHFVLDGPADIEKAEQLDAHIEASVQSLKALREFVMSNREKSISLNEADLTLSTMSNRVRLACQVSEVAELQFTVDCGLIGLRTVEVKMTPEKFDELAAKIAANEVSLTIGTSFDLAAKLVGKTSTPATLEADAKALLAEIHDSVKPETDTTEGFVKLDDLSIDGLKLPAMKVLLANPSKCTAGSTNLVNRVMSIVAVGLCAPTTLTPIAGGSTSVSIAANSSTAADSDTGADADAGNVPPPPPPPAPQNQAAGSLTPAPAARPLAAGSVTRVAPTLPASAGSLTLPAVAGSISSTSARSAN